MSARARAELWIAIVFMGLAQAHPWQMDSTAIFAVGMGLAVEPMVQLFLDLRCGLRVPPHRRG